MATGYVLTRYRVVAFETVFSIWADQVARRGGGVAFVPIEQGDWSATIAGLVNRHFHHHTVRSAEVGIATHAGSSLFSVCQIIEDTGLPTASCICIQKGMHGPVERIGFAVHAPQLVEIFLQIPGQGSVRIGMPKQFANIIGGHAHGFEIIGSGGACPMGSNRPKCVSVWVPLLIGEPCRLAEQRNEGIVEKPLADQFVSILKQILRWLPCFPILHQRLILWSESLPCQNSLCCVLRNWGPKFATVLVGWDP